MRTSVASRVLDAAGQEELSRREATECSHDVTTASTGSGRRVWRVDDLPRGGDPSPPGRRAAMPVDGARPWRLRAAAHLWSVRPMRPARPRRTLLQYAGVRGLEPARCSSRTRLSARRERPPAHAAGSRGRAPGRRAVQRAVLPPRLSAGAARADGLTSPSRRDPAHLDAELSGREEAFGPHPGHVVQDGCTVESHVGTLGADLSREEVGEGHREVDRHRCGRWGEQDSADECAAPGEQDRGRQRGRPARQPFRAPSLSRPTATPDERAA